MTHRPTKSEKKKTARCDEIKNTIAVARLEEDKKNKKNKKKLKTLITELQKRTPSK